MPRFERRVKTYIVFEGMGTTVEREATEEDKRNFADEYRQCLAPDEDAKPEAPPSDNPGPLPPNLPQDPVPPTEPPPEEPPFDSSQVP